MDKHSTDLAITCSKQRGCKKERVRVVQQNTFPEPNNPELGGLRRILPKDVRNQEIEIASHAVIICSPVAKLIIKKINKLAAHTGAAARLINMSSCYLADASDFRRSGVADGGDSSRSQPAARADERVRSGGSTHLLDCPGPTPTPPEPSVNSLMLEFFFKA